MQYLVFQLYATFAAMGGVAAGERRSGFNRPGRSAVFGLIGAALGLDRSDEESHLALNKGYGLALGQVAPGRLLVDFHTAQVPPKRKGVQFRNRCEELDAPKLTTILSQREYRTQADYIIALWARDDAQLDLEDIAHYLNYPLYVLYFGRKSCPLALPCNPKIIEAADVRVAIKTYIPHEIKTIAVDTDGICGDVLRVEQRRDALVSRERWQFGLRREAIIGA
jgi:CRISPR system Cascade subunit CasD